MLIKDTAIREQALANMAWHSGDLEASVHHFVNALKAAPSEELIIVSLGYALSSQDTAEFVPTVIDTLDGLEAAGAPPSFFRLCLRLDLGLLLAEDQIERRIQAEYINAVVKPATREMPKRPLFLWHVPKCSGTSLGAALSSKFYDRPIGEVVPSYCCPRLLRHCAAHLSDCFPVLTSSHLGVEAVHPADEWFQFTLLRDPLKRALSAWRQYRVAVRTHYHFRVLPRQGADWCYWPGENLTSWMATAPELAVYRQLSTFSPDLDPREAARRIHGLDAYVVRDNDIGELEQVFEAAEVAIPTESVPRDMNKSGGWPKVSSAELSRARQLLQPEYDMVEALVNIRSAT